MMGAEKKTTLPERPKKLPRLPKSTDRRIACNQLLTASVDARIEKRPLLHPPVASPYVGKRVQKIVYVSSSTPFISAVKRVRKLLDQVDKRTVGRVDLLGKGSDKAKIESTRKQCPGEPEEVLLKATARAIEKALNLALYFQRQNQYQVKIRTGTVGVVDDIVEDSKGAMAPDNTPLEDVVEQSIESKLPETQIRKTSVIEVAITLR
jgi:ribonuclease P/MRP protein subunit POP7